MSIDTNWDVSKYRSPHEPNYQWQLRKKFMELNKDRMPEDRLVCLAQTFANIEFLGCRYPKATMDLVEELSFGVVQEFRENRKNLLKRTFVSGSDAAESKVNRRGSKRKSEPFEPPIPASKLKYGRFVAAAASNSEPDKSPPALVTMPASSSFSAATRSSQTAPAATVTAPSSVVTPVEPEKAEASKRKRIVWDLGDDSKKSVPEQHQQQNRNQNNRKQPKSNFKINWNDPLSEFVIVRLAGKPDEATSNILSRSAGFCKMSQSTLYKNLPNGNYRCDVIINDQIVATSVSDRKNEARVEAQNLAIEKLSRRCYTLLIKNMFVSDGGATVDIDQLNDASKMDDSLSSNNIGHKLLQMMGWSGGGLGKEGSGIAEPITAQAVFNREGLGSGSMDKDFKGKIRKIIEDYAQSDSSFDLVFSTGFTNEQRKEMHDIARRLGLKSKSFGKNEDRFLTISRKQSSREVIRQLISRGGSNEKYDLIPPQ